MSVRLFTLLGVVCVILTSAAVVRAADLTIRGPIVDIDAKAKMLTVREPDQNILKVTLEPDGQVVVDGQPAQFDDLVKGQKVAVTMSKRGKPASRIEVGGMPANAGAPASGTDGKSSSESSGSTSSSGTPTLGTLPLVPLYFPYFRGPIYLRNNNFPKTGPVIPPPVRPTPVPRGVKR
jgi:hypothetical protein